MGHLSKVSNQVLTSCPCRLEEEDRDFTPQHSGDKHSRGSGYPCESSGASARPATAFTSMNGPATGATAAGPLRNYRAPE